MPIIYKVCSATAWQDAESSGLFAGSPDDVRDGFIHFSTAEQLPDTLAKHFAGRGDLLLIAVDADRLGPALKWEPSRGGALFPHLYAGLPVSAAAWLKPLEVDRAGRHVIPPLTKAPHSRG